MAERQSNESKRDRIRSVLDASYDEYLEYVYPAAQVDLQVHRAMDIAERQSRLQNHPYSAMLQLAFAEVDYADQWCWTQFGPAHGECHDAQSEYPSCQVEGQHAHEGTWQSHWYCKTDYNFGFNEWYFARAEDRDRFLSFVPEIYWGDKYPK